MAILLEDLQPVYDDSQMIDLVNVSVRKQAGIIVDANLTTPQGTDRLDFAKAALQQPSQFSRSTWSFMVGSVADDAGTTTDTLLRSVGDPESPSDSQVDSAVKNAIDSLWPITP